MELLALARRRGALSLARRALPLGEVSARLGQRATSLQRLLKRRTLALRRQALGRLRALARPLEVLGRLNGAARRNGGPVGDESRQARADGGACRARDGGRRDGRRRENAPLGIGDHDVLIRVHNHAVVEVGEEDIARRRRDEGRRLHIDRHGDEGRNGQHEG